MATTRSTPNRPVVGYLFLLAGALTLIGVLLGLVAKGVNTSWLGFLTDAALAIAFLLLFLGRTGDILTRAAFIVAAVGWALLAVNIFVNLGALAAVALVVAFVGSLVAGILVFLRRLFSRRANLWFLLAMIFGAIIILNALGGNFLVGILNLIVVVVYGVLLVVGGLFIAQRR
jgi:hypothetical protein